MPDFGRPDARRPGFGPQDPGGPGDPSLDAVRRTDSFVDALAGGRSVVAQDPADAELAALLGNWRDELRWPPATGLISEADAVAAFNAGLTQKRSVPDPERWTATQKRGRRGLSVVGISAAAVLSIGGFGAVVAGAGPGDALYGVRTMLFGAPKQPRDDQVALAAKTELNQVQDLIAQGNWDQAQDKLVAVSTQVATIDDEQQKQDLLDQFNTLSAKVVERDPEATPAPGVVYTVPPSSAQLVPAVSPTSTPGAPSLTESTTPTTSVSPSEATSTTSDTASTSTTAPSSSSASGSASSTAASSSESASSSPAPQSQTTTPTSAAPTTTEVSTVPPSVATTLAPASSEPASAASTPAPETTTADVPRAVGTTAVPSAETPVSQSAAPSPAVVATTEAPQESVPSAAVTTTLVPVPAGG